MRQRDKYIPELENVEVALLMEAIRRLHGLDLQEYALGALRRRIWESIRREKVRTVSGLQERLVHDAEAMARFLELVIPKSVPLGLRFLVKFREDLVPLLRTYPYFRIWQMSCANVGEAYLFAIILEEEGVYEKATIYSTDLDERAVQSSQDGLFPMEDAIRYQRLYSGSGGRGDFASYYSAGESSGRFDSALKRNIVFARHNLATDGSFNEFNAIFCRCSLKAFNPEVQERARHLLRESLVQFGILGLVKGDLPEETPSAFSQLDQEHNLYRRMF